MVIEVGLYRLRIGMHYARKRQLKQKQIKQTAARRACTSSPPKSCNQPKRCFPVNVSKASIPTLLLYTLLFILCLIRPRPSASNLHDTSDKILLVGDISLDPGPDYGENLQRFPTPVILQDARRISHVKSGVA